MTPKRQINQAYALQIRRAQRNQNPTLSAEPRVTGHEWWLDRPSSPIVSAALAGTAAHAASRVVVGFGHAADAGAVRDQVWSPPERPYITPNETLHDALSMAINRAEIVDVGYGFSGKPTCNMWNVGAQTSTNNDWCLTQDIAGANALLDANGYLDTDHDGVRETPGGLPLEFEFVTSTNAVRQAAQALIESYWEQSSPCE